LFLAKSDLLAEGKIDTTKAPIHGALLNISADESHPDDRSRETWRDECVRLASRRVKRV
jgi:hypothetical protein